VNERPFQFEWDEAKADANGRKHGITFELASTVFFDPNLLTAADVAHGEEEERWLSIGIASSDSGRFQHGKRLKARCAQYREGL